MLTLLVSVCVNPLRCSFCTTLLSSMETGGMTILALRPSQDSTLWPPWGTSEHLFHLIHQQLREGHILIIHKGENDTLQA